MNDRRGRVRYHSPFASPSVAAPLAGQVVPRAGRPTMVEARGARHGVRPRNAKPDHRASRAAEGTASSSTSSCVVACSRPAPAPARCAAGCARTSRPPRRCRHPRRATGGAGARAGAVTSRPGSAGRRTVRGTWARRSTCSTYRPERWKRRPVSAGVRPASAMLVIRRSMGRSSVEVTTRSRPGPSRRDRARRRPAPPGECAGAARAGAGPGRCTPGWPRRSRAPRTGRSRVICSSLCTRISMTAPESVGRRAGNTRTSSGG